jgi:hypothetical protein
MLLQSAPARADGLTGKVWEYIQPTNPVETVFLGLSARDDEHGLGWGASPESDPHDIDAALRQFENPAAAIDRIEALKRSKGASGGMLYAVFEYTGKGDMNAFCGVSNRVSSDLEEVRESSPLISGPGSLSSGLWRTFKRSTREERIRAVARCLANLPGMPPLKPTHNVIRHLYIDAATYRGARAWMRSLGMIGTDAQYDDAFRCLATHAGTEAPDATGDSVVFRTETEDNGQFTYPMIGGAVMNQSAAAKAASESGTEGLSGPWPSWGGFASNAYETALSSSIRFFEPCRQAAGLLASQGPVFVSPGPNCPH